MSISQISPSASYYNPQVTKKSEVADITAVQKTVSIETIISREEKIAAFLKNKPMSTYRYERMQELNPANADKFIDNMMEIYKTEFNDIPAISFRSQDAIMIARGLDTSEKIAGAMRYTSVLSEAHVISLRLRNTEEYKANGLKEVANHGEQAYDFTEVIDLDKQAEDWEWNSLLAYSSVDDLFQEAGCDTETGKMMVLPFGSTEWITAEEFSAKHPDYDITRLLYRYTPLPSYGLDSYKQYAESFIANLTPEEKRLIHNSNEFSDPGFKIFGIEGMGEYTKNYEDFTYYVKYDGWRTALAKTEEEKINPPPADIIVPKGNGQFILDENGNPLPPRIMTEEEVEIQSAILYAKEAERNRVDEIAYRKAKIEFEPTYKKIRAFEKEVETRSRNSKYNKPNILDMLKPEYTNPLNNKQAVVDAILATPNSYNFDIVTSPKNTMPEKSDKTTHTYSNTLLTENELERFGLKNIATIHGTNIMKPENNEPEIRYHKINDYVTQQFTKNYNAENKLNIFDILK